MNETAVLIVAFIYSVAAGTASDRLGERLETGELIPSHARGVYLPERAVLQLAPGSRARLGQGQEIVSLEQGALRLVADERLAVRLGPLTVELQPGAVAVLERSAARVEACAERGTVHLRGPGRPAAAGAEAADAGRDDTEDRQISAGQCWSGLAAELTVAGEETELPPLDPARSTSLRGAAEDRPPPPAPLADLVGDPSEQLAQVEQQLGESLASGPRREAASCGCSETSGGGGSLDPTGGGTGPEPEQPDPGQLRVRIRLPRR